MALSGGATAPPPRPRGPRNAAMRLARSCYDHLPGRLGVAIAEALTRRGFVHLDDGIGRVSSEGRRFVTDLGIDVDALSVAKRPLCRTCLDWSERRLHLSGKLGAAILERTIEFGWLARVPKSRTLRISRAGKRGFAAKFRREPVWRRAAPQPLLAIARGGPGNDFYNSAEAKPQEALRSG